MTSPQVEDSHEALRPHLRTLLRENWIGAGLVSAAADKTAAIARTADLLESGFGAATLMTDAADSSGTPCSHGAVAAEELGRGLFPNRWLPAWMASVLLRGTLGDTSGIELAWPGQDASWDVREIVKLPVTDGRLAGSVPLALLSDDSARLVFPAVANGELCAALVEAHAEGIARVKCWTPDEARDLVHVQVRDVAAEPVTFPDPVAAFRHALAVGVTCLSAEMVGAASFCLDTATSYARSRVQFRQPIGKFQVIRHTLADVLTAIETARASVYRAARSLDEAASEAETSARVARLRAAACLRLASEAAVQVHGGMGFTWDIPLHYAVKRWGTGASLFGTNTDHQVRIFRAISARSVVVTTNAITG